MTSSNSKPGLSIDTEGVHFISEELSEKLMKKSISPSMITSLDQCPAKWAGEAFVIRDIVEEQPDNAGRRGDLFHSVMEIFFAYPQDARTTDKMKEVVEIVLSSDEYKDMAEMPEAVAWLRDAINGYYSMGGDPTKVKVATIKTPEGEEKLGLEVFVKGQVGEANRETLGFIDQLTEDPRNDDSSVVVGDWKTGAKVKRYNKKKGSEGLSEARQQMIYTKILRDQGVKVSSARLIFPVVREVVTIDVDDQELMDRVIKDVEDTDKKLEHYTLNNTFEFKPSFLCSWCPLIKICPVGTVKPYAKMQEAYSKQPDIDILAKGFEL
jgi:hypothetical protein